MVDIHSHILPNVDDGSKSFADSIRMIQESLNQGINHIVITPHIFSPYMKCKTIDEIIPLYEQFKQQVKDYGIDINLYLGHEVSYNIRIFDYFRNNQFLSLNNKPIILLELPYENELESFEELRFNFECFNYSLILAHIERYDYYSIRKLRSLKKNNVYFQVNASSFQKSSKYYKKAIKLLKLGLIDFISSDVHHNRQNLMRETYEFIAETFGQNEANRIFYDNPYKLII